MGLLTRRATIAPEARILLDGQDILKFGKTQMRKLRGNRITMIFQEPMSSLNPVFSVGFQIGEVLIAADGVARLFVPGNERGIRHRLRELWHSNFSRHL